MSAIEPTAAARPVTAAPVRVEPEAGGALWRVVLDGPKGNVLDRAMVAALTATVRRAAREQGLRALILEGAGAHFSFGASVPEHLPPHAAGLLAEFHGLFLALLESGLPCLAAVRGQCLGGGLELAAFCQRVFAAPDARLGQPEIRLGVFAPVASLILPERIGRARAEELCLSGRIVDAQEALALGLVDVLADDPSGAALAWARQHLLGKSASSLRLAARALRLRWSERLAAELRALERLYLDELMSTRDATEGLAAFLEKRPPRWSDT